MIDTADALTAFSDNALRASTLALDTEFMREKTYRAELCLLQIANDGDAVCIDPIALPDLAALVPVMRAPGIVKIMHAARQDLEVLLPAVGLVRPVFDTQIAAALAGHPAQVGYAELARRLLGVELSKAHTRTDWSRRPLPPEQQEYALDDVRHLGPLRDSLLETLAAKGRLAWLEEDLASPRQRRRAARRPGRRLEEGQGTADARSGPPAVRAGARGVARAARRRAQSPARLDSRRCGAARNRAAPAAFAGGARRRCPRCRNPSCANAARNCCSS